MEDSQYQILSNEIYRRFSVADYSMFGECIINQWRGYRKLFSGGIHPVLVAYLCHAVKGGLFSRPWDAEAWFNPYLECARAA